MRSSVSFVELLIQAWREIFRSRQLLFWFGGAFGLLALASSLLNTAITPLLPEAPSNIEALLKSLTEKQTLLTPFLLLTLLTNFLYALLRGPYFLSLERLITLKPSTHSALRQPQRKQLLRGAVLSFFFELSYWGALALVFLAISVPLILALRYNTTAIQPIAQIGFSLWIILAITFFYLKEYALLYSLLAHLRLNIALELGLKLFKKHLLLSLLFGLFLMALALLFTFSVNLAIIASDFIGLVTWHRWISALCTVVMLGLGALIAEALRLFFFHALAATPKTPLLKKARRLVGEKNPGSAPSI